MKINFDDLIVKFRGENLANLMDSWTWLIGTDKKLLIVSVIGDMFLQANNGSIFWLDVGLGKLEIIAKDMKEFESKLENINQVDEWFMIDLTAELKRSEKTLKDGQVYSYRKLPVLGGAYSVDNFAPLDMEAHFRLTSEIHEQVRSLPDGTKVDMKVVD